jgi:hypothetical protein
VSIFYEIALTCDVVDCKAFEVFEGIGDDPKHRAASAGWRWTPNGRCLCEKHARREWPDSFLRKGHEFPDQKEASDGTDELLL